MTRGGQGTMPKTQTLKKRDDLSRRQDGKPIAHRDSSDRQFKRSDADYFGMLRVCEYLSGLWVEDFQADARELFDEPFLKQTSPEGGAVLAMTRRV